MKKTIENIILFIPLYWYMNVWSNLVFHYDRPLLGIGLPDIDADLLWVLMLMFGTPLTFIAGAVYTFLNKYWYWFTVYLLLGGGLIATLYIARFT